MLVNLKRDFFAGGRRYRVRKNPNNIPDDVKLPSDAEVVELEPAMVPKAPAHKTPAKAAVKVPVKDDDE